MAYVQLQDQCMMAGNAHCNNNQHNNRLGVVILRHGTAHNNQLLGRGRRGHLGARGPRRKRRGERGRKGRMDEKKRYNNQPVRARKHRTYNNLRIRGEGGRTTRRRGAPRNPPSPFPWRRRRRSPGLFLSLSLGTVWMDQVQL